MTCTAQDCDTVPPLGDLGDTAAVYTTDSGGHAMERSSCNFTADKPSSWARWQTIEVNASLRFQRMLGFGGAFTDAFAIGLEKMTADVRRAVLRQYFGVDGARYSVGRVPMASSDFSTHSYSYAPEKDDSMLHSFNLTTEDTGPGRKLELLKAATAQAPNGLKLFASAWSAPPWMKTAAKASDPWGGWPFEHHLP